MRIEESVVLGYLDINPFLKFPASFPAVSSPPSLYLPALSQPPAWVLAVTAARDLPNQLLTKFLQKKLS